MHLWFRTLLVMLRARRRSKLGVHDLGRLALRVLPTDTDLLGHINNGVYLSIMDLGRFDLLIRAGMWDTLRAAGIYPVVVYETISFRRSLDLWVRYELQTKVLGYDERVVYIEQRFVRDGEVCAVGIMAGRFLRRGGGSVGTAELAELLGVDRSELVLPDWVVRWAADSRLPSNREPFPSDWSI
ncbi:MAG: thioesterase family protein [Leucobacter sp.]|nr:thioesterase family protein [Leucobacter sp.]